MVGFTRKLTDIPHTVVVYRLCFAGNLKEIVQCLCVGACLKCTCTY